MVAAALSTLVPCLKASHVGFVGARPRCQAKLACATSTAPPSANNSDVISV